MAAGTFTVAGQRVRTSSQRRYVIFQVYSMPSGGPVHVSIYKRTDSFGKALAIKANYGWSATRKLVIIDTATGEEIVG